MSERASNSSVYGQAASSATDHRRKWDAAEYEAKAK